MKKLTTLLASLAIAFTLTSCDKAENTFDVLAIYPLSDTYHTIYADQSVDSITLQTTRDWTAKVDQSWMSLDASDKKGTVDAGKIFTHTYPVYFENNKSGKVRFGQYLVSSNNKGVKHTFLQTSWLNITIPAPEYSRKDGIVESTTFSGNIYKSETEAKIAFTCYGNATLASDAEWAVPSITTFEPGSQEVPIAFSENNTGRARTAKLTLTSAGISSVITIIQSATNPEKE